MTTDTHTPGPWHVGEVHARRIDIKSRDVVLAEVFTGPVEFVREREATARLIAAAPDLLACLQEMVDYANSEEFEGAPSMDAAERARLAIAKATGETP